MSTATRPCRHCGGTGEEPDPVAIGADIRAAREAAGLTLRGVAERVGCSHPYVAEMEAGRRPQGGPKARAIMAMLGVKP